MNSRAEILKRLETAPVVVDGEHQCPCGSTVWVRDYGPVGEDGQQSRATRIRCRACTRPVSGVCRTRLRGKRCTCKLAGG